jgi:hypothetical protein
VYQGIRGRDYLIPKVAADSASLPTYPLLWTNGTRRDSSRGALAWTIAENKLWKWNGTAWSSVGGTGGGTTITHPYTTLKYYTGYGTFGSFTDSARAALSAGTGLTYNSTTGVFTNSITQYTDALARAAISLTTTGTSGAATYNSSTGVFNIPQYSGGGGGVTGSGASPQVAYWSGASTLTGSSNFAWNNTSKALYFDGVTPSAWNWTGANGMALEVPKASLWLYTDFAFLNSNVFFDGAYKRKAIGTTSQLYMGASGVLGFRNAATGAANSAITWTDRFNVSADGKVGINTAAPPALLSVNSSSGNTNTGLKVTNTGTGIDVYAPIEMVNNASAISQVFLTSSNWTVANGARASGGGWTNSGSGGFSFIAYNAASDITFHTNTAFAERLRIDQNGGVNIGGAADAAASSLLEITSTTKGFLPPRMTTAERNLIASPAAGLIIFCTDCTATDGSTGVSQTYSSSTWKNHY